MTLPAGIRLGAYEILASLGAGGMGEMYRAKSYVLDYPSWSPDGKKIYFSVSHKTGDIYLAEGF